MKEPKKTKDFKIEDQTIDSVLRPENWDDYIGQDKVKKNLRLMIEAARMREEPIDHLLFYGQTGLGKTTLAKLVGRELGRNVKTTSGPAVERIGDLAAILSNLEPYDILFIDEAHRLNRAIEETLYPALESRELHIVIGKGVGARTVSLALPPFTMIGATTRLDLISAPLRSRFGATFRLDYYDEADIEKIINRSAKLLGVKINPDAANILATASRFTPRIANRLLKRARDYANVAGDDLITKDIAEKTLELLDVDRLGLEVHDRLLLSAIINRFNGGPVGINNLAAALNEDSSIIENVYEPYLIKIGLLKRTSAGRMVGDSAWKHLDIKPAKDKLI